ncbi:TIM barrel protein [Propionibacterium australiense]|uniref:Hydroxypyruvate isomerase n=1 Tax=Propionibacterium australiense TaxID=119981 RepID=A0A383S627_9ACTN|nr:TIM barrel protein [Propionibacterium australiense]RLP09805.1 hydroxypyruvate isomerase [Propionibacterium australiense]RLP10146.1 hydroxypyruvate isomerase [Propionibacterium australiense]SYZ33283.1 Hydroxypyruvate isomerase-like [Propionibacterium australiense]VEH89223.1 Hydroxypyruvate isomerase [Propionibacterium australiense]
MSTLTLAACAEMIFTDLPFVQRVEKIAARGLQVEMWNWTTKDLKELAATGATFSSMTGYVSGNLTDADAIDEFLESARRSVAAAEIIDSPRLNVHGTGLDGDGHPVRPVEVVTPDMWLTARDTLARLAEIGRAAGRVFTLENLNLPVDHAGTPFALAKDTRALVKAVDSPHLRMNLDLYHCQIGEGNLIETCRESLPWIGEIQVADVPGRCQPGTGEINYASVARALRAMGYEGVVAMEAFASGDSEAALDDFVAAFSEGAQA